MLDVNFKYLGFYVRVDYIPVHKKIPFLISVQKYSLDGTFFKFVS